MVDSVVWAECKCFHQKCLPLSSLACSVDFTSIDQFKEEYKDLLEDKDEEVVIGELMGVVEERRQRTRRSVGMRRTVKEAYVPLYRLKALY